MAGLARCMLGMTLLGVVLSGCNDSAAKTDKELPNRAPRIQDVDDFRVDENALMVGVIAAEDPDQDDVVYSISGGNDGALFFIGEDSGEIRFKTAPDFERPDDANQDGDYELIVTASDGRLAAVKSVVITVINVVTEPLLSNLSVETVPKQLRLEWQPVTQPYEYLQLSSAGDDFVFQPYSDRLDVNETAYVFPLSAHLFDWQRTFRLASCNRQLCSYSNEVNFTPADAAVAVNFRLAENARSDTFYGADVALSDDGMTMVISAPKESGGGCGVFAAPTGGSATWSGAVYVYGRNTAGGWDLQAFLKSPNAAIWHKFGDALALSADGNRLVVGESNEASEATGITMINGEKDSCLGLTPVDNSAIGAVSIFERNDQGEWSPSYFIKMDSAVHGSVFGTDLALSADGKLLAVKADPSGNGNGEVFVYQETNGQWAKTQQLSLLNGVNSLRADDRSGSSLVLNADGTRLAVGASGDDRDQAGTFNRRDSGAVYIFNRTAGQINWQFSHYLKPLSLNSFDKFGEEVAFDEQGEVLMVGAGGDRHAGLGV